MAVNWQEILGWIVLILLAVYGCAQAIRRCCLWLFRCGDCAFCCRLAVPRDGEAVLPLIRCLQSQSAWEDTYGCRYTLMLLSDGTDTFSPEVELALQECPSVIPVGSEDLQEVLAILLDNE